MGPREESVFSFGAAPVGPREESALSSGAAPVGPREESVLSSGAASVGPREESALSFGALLWEQVRGLPLPPKQPRGNQGDSLPFVPEQHL